MIISEDDTFSDADYETYTTTKNFTLSSGDGDKTVYVKYKDTASGDETESYSSSITLDTTLPTVSTISQQMVQRM